jgi:hypothetical protein
MAILYFFDLIDWAVSGLRGLKFIDCRLFPVPVMGHEGFASV